MWIARSKNPILLWLCNSKPYYNSDKDEWECSMGIMLTNDKALKEVTFDNSPIEVKLVKKYGK